MLENTTASRGPLWWVVFVTSSPQRHVCSARLLFLGDLEPNFPQADTNEIVSILGHELGHWKMSHTLQGFVITQSYLLASFCAFGLATELGESLRLSFGYSTQATLITLYLFFAVVSFATHMAVWWKHLLFGM